eukprot:1102113-Pleurochrysis_carterae.AAC.1
MTEEELNGLEEGVQYEQGRLTKGGTWGGGTEHQAMAIMLKINIVIWDRRYVGRVNEKYKQIYICTPQGKVHLTDVTQAAGIVRGDVHPSIHLIYDHVAKHYEYFGGEAGRQTAAASEPGAAKGKQENTQQIATEKRGEGESSGLEEEIVNNITEKGTSERREGQQEATNGKNIEGCHLEVLIGTLNVSGISYGYRGKYIHTTEDLLKIRPGDKLREIIEMMKTQGISLMTLTDTHLGQEGITEVGIYLRQEGMGGGGIAARKEAGEEVTTGVRRKAGIYYIWNPSMVSVQDITEVHSGRAARARVKALDSGNELEVYGIYMPVRKNDGKCVEDIWENVMEEITCRGTRNFVICGDFNAETEAWIKRNGRTPMEEDEVYQGVLEDLNLITSITNEYTFERARTQIDNILIPIELLHNLQTAHTATGVREKDHRLVLARLAWEVKGKMGEERPTCRYTDRFEEEHWQRYEQLLTERLKEIRDSLKDRRPGDRLTILQEAVTGTAAE